MSDNKKYKLGIFATHPIQYYVPWYKALARHPEIELKVFYCHYQSLQDQARAGFDVQFDWDIPLLNGYEYQFLNNRAHHPNVYTFFGCNTPQIMRLIYTRTFDAFIVHGWSVLSFWQAMIACWRTRTPILVRGDSQLLTHRSLIKRMLKYIIFRWFIPRFDAYLVVGKRARQYYLHYGAEERKMFFVPHSVDNDFFASRSAALEPERENLRKNWNIPEDSIVFLFVGKLIPKKRPYDFIKALKLAYKRSPHMFGLIVGDGPLRTELENLSKKNRLPITFTGFLNQTDLPKAYAVSDVLVLPSDGRETWGLVVNEAMASGLPAIVSDRVGCAPDLIYPGESGEIFPCGDIRSLSNTILTFAENPERLKYMGTKVKNLMQQYSVNISVGGTLTALNFVTCNKKKDN